MLAERHGGSRAGVAQGDLRRAVLDRLEGDLPRARARLEEVRQHVVRRGEAEGHGEAWWQDLLALERGSLARAEGRHAEARTQIHGARGASTGAARGAAASAVCLAGWGGRPRRRARGATLLGAGAGGEGLIGTVHVPQVRAEAPGLLSGRASRWARPHAAARAAGRAMSLEQAVAYALADAPDDA